MKYYKLIKNNFADALKVGKIYPENFREWGAKHCDINYFVNYGYAHFFEKIPAGEYFVQEGKMPEYFAIKRVKNNPLWQRYIDWLSKTYTWNWAGDCKGYCGFAYASGVRGTLETIKEFGENAVELTLEQWDEIINKTMKEKEIIGWKLKEECKEYKNAALRIIGGSILESCSKQLNLYLLDPGYSGYPGYWIENIKKAGVLELWFEPIYKEKAITFGGYEVALKKVSSGVKITCNGETGTFSQLEHIYNTILKKEKMMFGGQEVEEITYSDDTLWSRDYLKATATSIKIGCTTGTWDEFVAIYKKAKSML